MQKKFLAWLLTFCMVLSMVPISMSANTTEGAMTTGEIVDLDSVDSWEGATVANSPKYGKFLIRGSAYGLLDIVLWDKDSTNPDLAELGDAYRMEILYRETPGLASFDSAVAPNRVRTSGINWRVNTSNYGGGSVNAYTNTPVDGFFGYAAYTIKDDAILWVLNKDGEPTETATNMAAEGYAELSVLASSFGATMIDGIGSGNFFTAWDIAGLKVTKIVEIPVEAPAEPEAIAEGEEGEATEGEEPEVPAEPEVEIVETVLLDWGSVDPTVEGTNYDVSALAKTVNTNNQSHALTTPVVDEYISVTGETTATAIDATLAAGVYEFRADAWVAEGDATMSAVLGGVAATEVYDLVAGARTPVTYTFTLDEATAVSDLALEWAGAETVLFTGAELEYVADFATLTEPGDSFDLTKFDNATAVDIVTNSIMQTPTVFSYNYGGMSIDVGATFAADTEYTISFKFRSATKDQMALRFIVPGAAAEGKDINVFFDAPTDGDWAEYALDFTPAKATTATTVKFSGGTGTGDKMGFAIDDLKIVEKATGTAVVPTISDWENVALTSATAVTEESYITLPVGADGANASALHNNTVFNLVAGKYSITGDFRTPFASRANVVNLANGGKMLKDFNGIDVVAKITFANGDELIVPAVGASEFTVDAGAVNWTALTFNFELEEAAEVNAVEFLATGYDVVVDGTVVTKSGNLVVIQAADDLAKVQTLETAKPFDMKNAAITLVELPFVKTPVDLAEVGDSFTLDATNMENVTEVDGKGTYLNVTNLYNKAAGFWANLCNVEANITYTVSYDVVLGASSMATRQTHYVDGKSVLNVYPTINSGESYSWEFTPATSGTYQFNMYAQAILPNFAIDNLTVTVKSIPEGTETELTVGQVLFSDNFDTDKGIYVGKSIVGDVNKYIGLECVNEGDYLTVETGYAATLFANTVNVVPGVYKLTADFRGAEWDMNASIIYTTADIQEGVVEKNKYDANFIRDVATGIQIKNDYNGINVNAIVTYADGTVATYAPDTRAANAFDAKVNAYDAMPNAWSGLTYTIPVYADNTIEEIEFKASGYDMVSGVAFPVDSAAFQMQAATLTLDSAITVLDEVGDKVALDDTLEGTWAGQTATTADANEFAHFNPLSWKNDKRGFYVGEGFEVGTTYKVQFNFRTWSGSSMNTCFYAEGTKVMDDRGGTIAKPIEDRIINQHERTETAKDGRGWIDFWNDVGSNKWKDSTEFVFTPAEAGTGLIYFVGSGGKDIVSWDIDDVVVTVVTPVEGSAYTAGQVIFSTKEADAAEDYYTPWSEVEFVGGYAAEEVTEYNTVTATGASYTTPNAVKLAAGTYYKLAGAFRSDRANSKVMNVLSRASDGITVVDFNGADIVAKLTLADGTVLTVPAKFALDFTMDVNPYDWTDVDFVFDVEEDILVAGVEFLATGYNLTVDGTVVTKVSNTARYNAGEYELTDVTTEAYAAAFYMQDVTLECISEDEANEEYVCAGHVKALEAEIANEVKGDCQTLTSYDEVFYCQICGQVVSSTTVTGDTYGDHSYVDGSCELCGKHDPSVAFDIANLGDTVEMDETTLDNVTTETGKGTYLSISEMHNISVGPYAKNIANVEAGITYTVSFTTVYGAGSLRTRHVIAGKDVTGSNIALAAGQTVSTDFTPAESGTYGFKMFGNGGDIPQNFGIDNLTVTVKEIPEGTETELSVGDVIFSDNFDTVVEGRYSSYDVLGEVAGLVVNEYVNEGEYFAVADGKTAEFANTINVVKGIYKLTANFRDTVWNKDEIVRYTKADAEGDNPTASAYRYAGNQYGDIVTRSQVKENYLGANVDAVVTYADGSVVTYAPATRNDATLDAKVNVWTALTYDIVIPADNAITNIKFVTNGYTVVDKVITATENVGVQLKDVKLTLDATITDLTEIGDSVEMDETTLDNVTVETGKGTYLSVSNMLNISVGPYAQNIANVEAGITYTVSFTTVYGAGSLRTRHVIAGKDVTGSNIALAAGQTVSTDFTPAESGTYGFKMFGNGGDIPQNFGIDNLTVTVKEIPEGTETELSVGDVIFSDNFDTVVEGRYSSYDVLGEVAKHVVNEYVTEGDYLVVAKGETAEFSNTVNVVEGEYEITANFRDTIWNQKEIVRYTAADAEGENPTASAYKYDSRIYADIVTRSQVKENYNGANVDVVVTYADGSTVTYAPTTRDAKALDAAVNVWTALTFKVPVTAANAITNIKFVTNGYEVVGGVITATENVGIELKDVALTYVGEIGHEHVADEAVIENEKAATCTTPASYDEVVYCAECGTEMNRTTVTGTELGDHVEGAVKVENKVDATCFATGSYDNVVYCSACGEELSRETIPTDKIPHNFVDGECTVCFEPDPDYVPEEPEDGYVFTATADPITVTNDQDQVVTVIISSGKPLVAASYTILFKGDEFMPIEVVSVADPDNADIMGGANLELIENADGIGAYWYGNDDCVNETAAGPNFLAVTYLIPAGTEPGEYQIGAIDIDVDDEFDIIIEDETALVTITVEANAVHTHTPAVAVKEKEVAATCTTEGSYDSVVYCSECGEEISRETIPTEKLEHTPAVAVKEKEVAATCTKEGSYDSVVYCSVCGEELSRETIPTEAKGHEYVTTVEMVSGKGNATTACANCGTVVGSISEIGKTLSLSGEIFINLYSGVTGFTGIDVAAKGGLLEWRNVDLTEETATIDNNPTITEGLLYDSRNKRYAQQSGGVASKCYSDTIYLRVYVEIGDGEYAYGPLVEYSVRTYCENQINKHYNNSGSTAKNRALADACVALLHYGTAAQYYFDNYRIDDLANKNIVDKCPAFVWDQSYLTDLAAVNTNIVTDGTTVTEVGKTLSLSGAIFINFYSKTTIATSEVESAELLYWAGVSGQLTEDNVTSVIEMTYDSRNKRYGGQSDMISAKDYGTTVYACTKITTADGVFYGPVIPYSPEAYTKGRLEKSTDELLKNTVKNMTIYGEYATIYFNK